MNALEYTINMRPGVGVPPTVNVSQGDLEREICFDVMDGLNPFEFTGNETCVITGTKPSGLGFTVDGQISGSQVTFFTTEEMTQEDGAIRTELIITDSVQLYRVGSANFSLVVEPTTHASSVIDGTTEDARTVLEECEQYANDAASSAQQAAQSAAGAATAGATAGAAAGEEAAQEVVGVIEDELEGLREDLNEITGPNKNLLYYYPYTSGGASISFVNDDIIVTATSTSTYRMVYCDIPVGKNKTATLSYNSKTSESQGANAAGIRYGFVDNSDVMTWKGYISSSPTTINVSGVNKIGIGLYVATDSVTAGTKATFNKLQLEWGEQATEFSKKKYDAVDMMLQKEVDAFEENFPSEVVDVITDIGFNKYNPDTKIIGFIANNTGGINTNSNYFTSDFIDVSEFEYGYAFTPKARKILFYDANKDVIAASFYSDETAAGVIALNSTYKYVRMSWYKTSADVMVCDASALPAYVPYEIVAKDGINYINNETERKIRQMVGEGGKSTQIASYLNGKTVLVFGDSIMHGAGNNDDGIADLLADKYGMIAEDYSVSGATMGVRTDSPSYTVDEVHHIAKQVRNAISASVSPDLIIFNGGTNDIGGEITIGTMSDVYTQPSAESYFANGFETVAYLLMSNFVGVPIIYMRAHNMSSRTYQGQVDYGELGLKIAEKWGIRTIDMYKRMNTQLTEYRTAYLADYTHPNEAGYNKYYVPALEDFIFRELV